jgi:N-acetylglutamate synthase-like GNAT family acetyltransferase
MLDNSNLIISAWEEDRLVGIARALSDYGYCCYLADLVIDKKYQQIGVGSSLIRLIQKAIGIEVSLVLISAPDTTQFYEKLGFRLVNNGYIANGIY